MEKPTMGGREQLVPVHLKINCKLLEHECSTLIVDYDSYLSYKNDSLHPKMRKEMSSLYLGLMCSAYLRLVPYNLYP
jgi:hypothetical protein